MRGELESLGARLVGVSVDDMKTSAALAGQLGLGFPLAADPTLKLAIAPYGVAMKGEPLAVPATFVIRPDRTIAWRYIGETMTDRPQSAMVLDVVRAWAQQGAR